MKDYKKICTVLLLVGSWMTQGCSGIFDELAINPNQPSMGAYFTTPAAVNEAVMTMYGYISTQRCLGASGSKTTIIRSDEASSNSDYGKPGMFGADLNASYYTIEQPYTLMYTTASQASYIIQTTPTVNFGGNSELQNAYIGEAYFWRAFAHYYLLINFRNISPIKQMPRNSEDYIRPLEAPAAVWNSIQEDLENAKRLLPVKGYWSHDNAGRVTKASAAALLGKSYLYRSGIEKYYGEDKTSYYSEAAKEFADIINENYGVYDLENYADNFDVTHENNNESLLEIQFLGDVNNAGFNPGTATSGLAFDSRGLMLPGAGVGYEGVVHTWLYNAFVSSIDKDGCTDIRMFSTMMFNDRAPEIKLRNDAEGHPIRLKGPGGYKWEELYPTRNGKTGFATVSNTLAHPFKAGFKKGIDYSMPAQLTVDKAPSLVGVGAGVKENVYNQPRAHGANWRFIRYADVLLMYAEAIVNGGVQSINMTPVQAVNKVRERANLSDLPSVTMDDIERERVLELALEGHRFYDLLRWGKLAKRFADLQNTDPTFKKFVSAGGFKGFVINKHEWLPIPLNEVNTNPYITTNNPGY